MGVCGGVGVGVIESVVLGGWGSDVGTWSVSACVSVCVPEWRGVWEGG